jgi:elongation factor Ts
MAVSIDQIKQLREATGIGIMDCRKALEQADGDYDKALELLREKGMATAAKRAEREASEGVVELYSHGAGRIGVMVEVNCETDFVARSESFRTFAHEIALQIAANAPEYIRSEDIPAEVLAQQREEAANNAREEGKPEETVEKIVDGRLEKFVEAAVLLEQPYIRDENLRVEQLLMQNIASLGENVVIRRFVRWELGDSKAN